MKRFWLGCLGLAAAAAVVVACGGSDDGSESGPGTSSPAPSPGSPSSPRPGAEGDGVDVGPEGGAVTANGVTVEVPAGALDAHVMIAVTKEPARPDGYTIDGDVLRFSPEGLHFAKPITVSFPAGAEGHGVHWTLDGDATHFEPLETMVEGERVIAHPTHFSGGFVGASVTGVTCITKRRANCVQTTTIENDVKFWFQKQFPGQHPEDAIASASPGLNAYYNATGPHWFASDGTRTRYDGYESDHLVRSGNVVSANNRVGRGGVPDARCPTMPLIEVSCSGMASIAPAAPPPPPPPADAGADAAPPPVDAGADAAPPDDGGADAAPPPTGVTCISKRRVVGAHDPVTNIFTCTQSTTVEENVKLWLAGPIGDPQSRMASSSAGMAAYTNSPVGTAYWSAVAPYTVYTGYGSADRITRNGNTVTAGVKVSRGGAVYRGCENVPLIAVECNGTTSLGK